jgi:hypothetical protein
MPMINKCIYNQPPKDFTREDLKVVVVLVHARAQSMANSEEALNEHGSCVISTMKLPCLFMESFSPDFRVGASQNSMTHGFSISRDSL